MVSAYQTLIFGQFCHNNNTNDVNEYKYYYSRLREKINACKNNWQFNTNSSKKKSKNMIKNVYEIDMR